MFPGGGGGSAPPQQLGEGLEPPQPPLATPLLVGYGIYCIAIDWSKSLIEPNGIESGADPGFILGDSLGGGAPS